MLVYGYGKIIYLLEKNVLTLNVKWSYTISKRFREAKIK